MTDSTENFFCVKTLIKLSKLFHSKKINYIEEHKTILGLYFCEMFSGLTYRTFQNTSKEVITLVVIITPLK